MGYLQRQRFIIKHNPHIILWETTIHKSPIRSQQRAFFVTMDHARGT